MNQLDIIIVNYNSTDYLLQCLESIYRDLKTRSANIFIFDNGSIDGPGRVVDKFPEVHLILGWQNIGFARAVNACIAQGNSPYILVLNPDTAIMDGFFQSVLQYMEKNQRVGILGPRIYNQDVTVQGSARAFPSLITSLFGRNSILTKIFPDNRVSRKNVLHMDIREKAPVKVDWVSGACMVIRRQAVEDVGLMDARFFMYWEDADWCSRMHQKEWDVFYYPDASIIHYVGASSERNLIKSVIEFHKSVYYFYCKHYNSSFGLMNIMILVGLSIRICFVLSFHGIRRWRKHVRRDSYLCYRKTEYLMK